MLSIGYDYRSGEDPPVVREAKWLLDQAAYWLLGWWLLIMKHYWPSTARAIDNVPNAMSVARIIVSPFVAYALGAAIWNENSRDAWMWLGVTAGLVILDGLDGPLARRLDAVSDFGKAIDPAADKMLIVSLGVVYCVMTWHFLGPVPCLLVSLPLSVMLTFEIKLIMIAQSTKELVDMLSDVALPGANVNGKIKFSLQSTSFLVAYLGLVLDPDATGSYFLLFSGISVACYFASRSLKLHQQDVEWLEYWAWIRDIKRPEPKLWLRIARIITFSQPQAANGQRPS